MTAPKIVYIGNDVAPWCTEVHMTRALEECGATVLFVRQDDAHRMGPAEFVSLASEWNADLVLYTRTHNATALGFDWEGEGWRELARRGITTASFHLDRFWDLERQSLIYYHDPLFTVDHVFTADGGNDERWAQAGINHHWLPPAVDRHEAEQGGTFNRRMAHDVVFTGSGQYHSEYDERNQLITFLHSRYGRRFAHYGHNGGRSVVRGQALNDLLASARVVVGDSCFANAPDWRTKADRYISDRVPETLGRGGALVHPWNDMLAEWPITMHTPGDFESLVAGIDVILERGGEMADTMRRGNRQFVLNNHTYTHRARTLLETVGLLEPVSTS